MTLRDLQAYHARGILTDPAHHGELVTYTPAGGDARQVRAVVDRLGRVFDDDTRTVAHWRAVVFVPADADVGVLEVAPGDQVQLALTDGGAQLVTCRVVDVQAQDAGGWRFEVVA